MPGIAEIKPFLKWAGGKEKSYNQLVKFFPSDLGKDDCNNYYEPFLGSGAVFFNLCNKLKFKNITLSDINEELILVYKVVQFDVYELIDILEQYKNKYLKLSDVEKEKFYYDLRTAYNIQRFNINFNKYSLLWIFRAAQMIFLNKTCFNGLYRQNRSGEFNVPFGKNYKPNFDINNLLLASSALSNVEILTSDFEVIVKTTPKKSFVYLDPPYKPISKTSHFCDYYKLGFTNSDNERLNIELLNLSNKGAKFLLSNSYTIDNEYLDNSYKDFRVSFITANRSMSAKVQSRGLVSEVIVTNY